MKKYSVFMTHTATEDLKGIASYVANELKEPSIAKKLVQTIKEAVMSLDQMPTRYSLLRDASLAFQGIRRLMVDNYMVVLLLLGRNVFIVVKYADSRV
ncbi:type II toxin-antitoxin system RelE/ParE family toxin [Desulfosporosinus sp. BICA1-9]|uniref:type II toxin-antitoxin system RelE/ParE family toxin n=1 Tax=Desulfosporosinus sp. BICA1-9 TaxID=1531958 RepID=UPI0005F0CC0A|nr:type II toxin-antitoxin system RelE/ParE family toxin [Desulfosporosinus sp. BICA1-9]KJS49267.1 MAG: hypothetical protein VR66_09410 [Peptococcaceae bacterium BRH_c23]KJS89176.1 MAG: hypothetical protein JL57_08735 [Desulfosporosinus sp. BICA1-9]HBW37089.1 type II toxin-antitoxin system RelE/ParE family toxin [Desulfosporosinus sp.]